MRPESGPETAPKASTRWSTSESEIVSVFRSTGPASVPSPSTCVVHWERSFTFTRPTSRFTKTRRPGQGS